MKEKIIHYLKESYAEFKKVRWLTPRETFYWTLNIIFFILIFSTFFGIADLILSRLIIFIK